MKANHHIQARFVVCSPSAQNPGGGKGCECEVPTFEKIVMKDLRFGKDRSTALVVLVNLSASTRMEDRRIISNESNDGSII